MLAGYLNKNTMILLLTVRNSVNSESGHVDEPE